MDLTLDYNIELFPLQTDQNFALALASSLSRGGGPSGATAVDGAVEDAEDKDRDVWRSDGKGHGGLQDDYDYVMYGKVSAIAHLLLNSCSQRCKVYKFDGGTAEVV